MCSSSDRVSGDDFLPSDGKGWEDDLAAQYEENGVPRPDERPSTVFPEQFAAYCEHFVDFFPRSPYFVRTTYDGGSRYGGWPEKKSKKTGRPLPLVDSGKWLNKTDCVERHLDYEQWLLFKQTTEPSEGHERFGDYYWLGMTRPKKTKFHSIDFDNKRILGYYGKPVLPVVHMPLDHFKAMKRIYEEFPHRIWCITSETLGLDIIERHKLLDSDEIHDRVKRRLSQIGLGNTEVHPMRGRCKRRPFGTHYRTITADGVLDTWQTQLNYYQKPGPTPSFEQIFRALLECLVEQWRCWLSKGDAKNHRLNVTSVLEPHRHHFQEIKRWFHDGCPVNEPVQIAVLVGIPAEPESPPSQTSCKVRRQQPVSDFNLQELRNGNWAKGLERIARNGLTSEDSVGHVAHELAKFLWWVELYDRPEPDREREILELLVQFVTTKNNGFITRWNDDHKAEVLSQLDRCLRSAIDLDVDHRSQSLECFALIRQKRQAGQYRHVINLRPLITGACPSLRSVESCLEPFVDPDPCLQHLGMDSGDSHKNTGKAASTLTSLSLPSIYFSVGGLEALDAPLAEPIVSRINEHCGRSRLHRYGTRLLNHLFKSKGVCRIPHEALSLLLGYQDRKRTTKYTNILIKAGLLEKDHYVRGKRTCGYWLTKEARQMFEDAKRQQIGVA
jgi:hypothetical protein